MRISPSQLQDWNACPRRWWFKNVRRVPTVQSKSRALTFGTVTHGVAERWLKATDTGLDPETGKPVDLYPNGWEFAVERDGSRTIVNTDDRALIRSLIDDAVRRSVLRRLPGRQVEHELLVWVMPDVEMKMVVDQRNHEVVEDHKTPGKRAYAMGSEKLARDAKMLCYAYAQLQDYPNESKDGVRLRLNQLCKDESEDPPTWATEALVPTAKVTAFWRDLVVPAAQEMVHLATRNLSDEDWSSVEGAREQGACTDYDGCAFQAICGGRCTVEKFRQRAEPKQLPRSTTGTTKKATDPMGMFNTQKPAPAAPAATPAPTPETSAPAQPPVTDPTPTVIETIAPPWADPDCNACKGTGVNSKGHPCGACDRRIDTFKTGRPHVREFRVWHEGTTLRWESLAGAPATAVEVKIETTTIPPPPPLTEAQKAAAKALESVKQVVVEQSPNVEGAPGEPADVKPKTRKAKAALQPLAPVPSADMRAAALAVAQPGFVLFINCLPLGEEYIDLATLLRQEGQDLAEAKGASSFYELDSFKRRDMLAAQVGTVAATLEGKNVVALSAGPDMKAYLDALRPLARRVVVGTF